MPKVTVSKELGWDLNPGPFDSKSVSFLGEGVDFRYSSDTARKKTGAGNPVPGRGEKLEDFQATPRPLGDVV